MTRTFRINVKEIAKKDGSCKFPVANAKINDKWYKVKFTKDCDNAPRKAGLYDLTVDDDEMSIQTGTVKNEHKQNDIIWVHAIVTVRRYSDDDIKEYSRAKVSSVFDNADTDSQF